MSKGEINMNTTNNEENNKENKKEEAVVYTDAMLPELNHEDIETAESVHCKSWVLRMLESGRVGCFNWNEEMGLGLQTTGENSIRCFAAGNIHYSLRSLAMLKHSCEAVGVVFETEGYTVLIQPDSEGPAEETETTSPAGMEVA